MEKFTKMKLKELMNIEERLLHIQMTHMFDMPFNDIVLLKNHLKEIGDITSIYFELVEEYCEKDKVEQSDLSYDEKKNIVQEYNDNILNSEVYNVPNYHDILIFLDKYQNLTNRVLNSSMN